jgi:hypothetical protein
VVDESGVLAVVFRQCKAVLLAPLLLFVSEAALVEGEVEARDVEEVGEVWSGLEE